MSILWAGHRCEISVCLADSLKEGILGVWEARRSGNEVAGVEKHDRAEMRERIVLYKRI
jgi:hypothetical protein